MLTRCPTYKVLTNTEGVSYALCSIWRVYHIRFSFKCAYLISFRYLADIPLCLRRGIWRLATALSPQFRLQAASRSSDANLSIQMELRVSIPYVYHTPDYSYSCSNTLFHSQTRLCGIVDETSVGLFHQRSSIPTTSSLSPIDTLGSYSPPSPSTVLNDYSCRPASCTSDFGLNADHF